MGIRKSFLLALHFINPIELANQLSIKPKLTIIIYCLQFFQLNYFQSNLLQAAKRYFNVSYFQWSFLFHLVFIINHFWFHPVLYWDHSCHQAKNLNYCSHCYFITKLLVQLLPFSFLLAHDYLKQAIAFYEINFFVLIIIKEAKND